MRRGRWWFALVGVCLVVVVWRLAGHGASFVQPACALPSDVQYKGEPFWSADGRRAILTPRSGDQLLGVILDTSGAKPRLLRCWVFRDRVKVHPSLDGTGARLFYAAGPEDDVRIWVMTVASGETQEVTSGAWPLAAPAGDALAYKSLSGSNTIPPILRVTHGRGPGEQVTSAISFVNKVAWSPDGKAIAYTGRRVNLSAEGDELAVASVSGGKPREIAVPGSAGGDYGGLAWIDVNTLAVATRRQVAGDQKLFGIVSCDVTTGATRQLLPLNPSQALQTYGGVSISDGAKRAVWDAPPDNGGRYGSVDLATGKSAAIQFPEDVVGEPSPDGRRVLATGRQTGALYLAQLAANGSQWTIEKLQLK